MYKAATPTTSKNQSTEPKRYVVTSFALKK
jgi:hypothetical protein